MAVVKNNGSHLRSKEDEERLARQKAANPTNVTRAKELAKQYSNPHNFSNTTTVTKKEYNPKWYSGNQPTARETVARMYEVANGDRAKFQELESQFNAERNNRGSVIYNPYAQATNSKAIQGLAEMGIAVPEKITSKWLDDMWREYGQYSRPTTTGYGPAAPTKTSSRESNIAYWVKTLLDDEADTSLAEQQISGLYNEVKYWADLGYSDNEIIKRVRDDFGGKYNVLNQMDEQRLLGDAVRLNRAVDYSGDDTLYGMIWAARNNGGSGDYFVDSVKYTMGQGTRYKADPNSEAARDPSNYEGYHPYIMGSTLHDLNQKYGVTSINQQWLDDNRWMLNDPDKADDYREYSRAFEKTEKAAAELAALDQWISQQIEKGTSEEDLISAMEAAITDGSEIRVGGETIRLSTLADMEDERKNGTAMTTAYALDFTLPRYIDKINDMYAANSDNEDIESEPASKGYGKGQLRIGLGRLIADISGGKLGSYGAGDAVLDAQVGAADPQAFMANFMKTEFGIDFEGALTEAEEQAIAEAIASMDAAKQPSASKEEREAGDAASEKLYLIGQAIADSPHRHARYEDEAAYSTVFNNGKQDDLYARGMVEGDYVAQSYTGDADTMEASDDFSAAYEAMLRGSEEWNSEVFAWGLEHSDNPDLVLAELRDGIAKQMMGEKGTASSRSWMNKFGNLTRNTDKRMGGPYGKGPDAIDSRSAYGSQIYNALIANEKALEMGAISTDEFIGNLVNISVAADAVSKELSGRASDNILGRNKIERVAEEILNSGDGSMAAGVASIEAHCNELIAGKEEELAAQEEAHKALIVSGRDAAIAGQPLTYEQSVALGTALAADISAAKRNDKTYKNYNYILDSYGSEDSVAAANTPESAAAATHNFGVSMLAQNILEQDMHIAAALGMSLSEYYEAYPDQAKDTDDMLATAETEFNAAWKEFADSPEGLQVLDAFLRTGVMPGDPPEGFEGASQNGSSVQVPLYDMTAFDVFREATSIWGNQLDMNLAKTLHFFKFDFGNEDEKRIDLLGKYENDPAKLRAAWDNILISDDRRLTDEIKGEIGARLDTATDIFTLGDPDALLSQLDIAKYEAVDQQLRQTVQINGTKLESIICDAIVAAQDMITMMATSAVGSSFNVPGYVSSLVSTAPGELSSAYDYTRETGNSNSAALWAMSSWVVNAAIEQWSMDKYLSPHVSSLDDTIEHARYIVGKKGLAKALRSPEDLARLAKGAAAFVGRAGSTGAGELVEEFSQSTVSSAAENIATNKGYLISEKNLRDAFKEGLMGFALGGVAGSVTGGLASDFTDVLGNEIRAGEAVVQPEYDGNLINSAIEFEATATAIHASAEQLNALAQSPENIALEKAATTVIGIEEEAAAADAAAADAISVQAEAALALENLNLEALESDAFTEDMAKQMTEISASLQEANKRVEETHKAQQEAHAKLGEAIAERDSLAEQVQAKFREILDAFKAEAEQKIVDKYYSGSTEEQKASIEKYRAACAQLEAARKRLLETQKDNFDRVARGRELLAVDALIAEVDSARAEMEAAFANTPEGNTEAEQQAELTKAQQTAETATAEAEVESWNMKKRAAADLAESRLRAVEAKQKLESTRSSVEERLQSSDAEVRSAAVAEWQAAQQEAEAAEQAASDAEAIYNETDAQKRLREAMGEVHRYTNEQLLFEDMEGHAEAVAAYNRLSLARAEVEAEKAMAKLNAAEIGTPEYDDALKAFDQANEYFEDEGARLLGSDGDAVRAMFYNPKQYPDGVEWAYQLKEGSVFTSKDQAQFYEALAGKTYNNEQRVRTSDDGYIVRTDSSLIFSRGDYESPEIYGIIKAYGDHAVDYITILEDEIYGNANSGGNSFDESVQISNAVFDEGEIECFSREDEERKSENPRGKRSGSRKVADGGGNGRVKYSISESARGIWADHRTAGITGEETIAEQNPIEIMRKLTRSIRTGYHPGGNMSVNGRRMPKAIAGFYTPYADAITTRTNYAGNLDVSLHEFGHAVHERLKGLHATEEMKRALSKEVQEAYSSIELDGEAVAEFVVDYMFNRDNAVKRAGAEFVQQFEDMVREDWRLYNAIKNAQDQIVLWNNASIESKAQAQMKNETVRHSELGSLLSRIVRNVETGVFDLTAPAKLVSRDFHEKALYTMHATNRSDVILSQRMIDPITNKQIGKGFAEALFDVGVNNDNVQRVITYQMLKHHLARLKEGKPVFDVKEFPKAAVEETIKKMESETPEIEDQGKAFTDWWNFFVDVWLVGTGFVSKETIDRMRAKYPDYLPTFRVRDVDVSAYGGKQSSFKLHSAVEGGSSLEIINPMYSIAAQVQKVVKAVTQNQLLQAFDNEYIKKGGLGQIAEDVTEEMQRVENDVSRAMEYIDQIKANGDADPDVIEKLIREVDGLSTKFIGTGKGMGQKTVSVILADGRTKYYKIIDNGLFNLLSANKTTMNNGLRVLSAAKGVITSLTTGSNPFFALKNMIRDYQASVNTGTWAATYATGVVKWMKAFTEVVGQSEVFKDWLAMGGGEHTRMNAAVDEKTAKTLQKELSKMLLQGTRTKSGEFKVSKNALQFMEGMLTAKDFNNIIEYTSRFVEYRFGKHDLTTTEGRIEAFMASQDVTTNFGTRGSWEFVNILRQVTPFMNATLQGIHKDAQLIADLFSKDKTVRAKAIPKVAKTALNNMLLAGFQWALLALFKKGDEDDEEFAMLSDAMKAGNFIIPMNEEMFTFLRDNFGFSKPYWRLPIGQGILTQGMYAASIAAVGDVANYSPFEIDIMDTIWSIFRDGLPNTATVAQSVLDARRNKTWYNGNIEDYQMERYSTYNRADEDTPGIITETARLFGISPAKTDYVAQQTSGYLYRVLAPILSGEGIGGTVNSVLNYFTIDPVTTNDTASEFFSARTVISETINEAEDGLPMGHIAYGVDGQKAYNEAKYLEGVFADAYSQTNAINDEIKAIEANPNLTQDEKVTLTREANKEKVSIYQEALAEYDKFDMEYVASKPQILNRLYDWVSKGYSRPTID